MFWVSSLLVISWIYKYQEILFIICSGNKTLVKLCLGQGLLNNGPFSVSQMNILQHNAHPSPPNPKLKEKQNTYPTPPHSESEKIFQICAIKVVIFFSLIHISSIIMLIYNIHRVLFGVCNMCILSRMTTLIPILPCLLPPLPNVPTITFLWSATSSVLLLARNTCNLQNSLVPDAKGICTLHVALIMKHTCSQIRMKDTCIYAIDTI